jgi:hypothetical protein
MIKKKEAAIGNWERKAAVTAGTWWGPPFGVGRWGRQMRGSTASGERDAERWVGNAVT